MLQSPTFNILKYKSVYKELIAPYTGDNMSELEVIINERIERFRQYLKTTAKNTIFLQGWKIALDNLIRTDDGEYLDEPSFSEKEKLKMVQSLHKLNLTFHSYNLFLQVLSPIIKEVVHKKKRDARILELASGSGEFTLAMAALAKEKNLPAQITGSDVVPKYISSATKLAKNRNLDVKFKLVNAFDMTNIVPGEFDIIFTANSMHHFNPGKLAIMIAQSTKAATTAFVGMDGYRSLFLLWLLPTYAALTFHKASIHDAFVTARKFYSQAELELIAKTAAPDANISVSRSFPGYSILKVKRVM